MIAIIIVNYNDWDNLKLCINSISLEIPYKVYVVDSDSKASNYIQELRKNSKVTFIQSPINGGYSFGNNLGLKRALEDGCDYFLISNTDIIFNKNSIENLISPLEDNICDIVGPKVILSNGKRQEEILGVRVRPISKLKLIMNSVTNGILFKDYKIKFNNIDRHNLLTYKVYGVSGCCFAFNKLTFTKVFPFDEHIFLYNEEWMLAEKAYRANLRTMINCKSVVQHMHGSTTKNIKLFSYACFIKSEFYVLRKLFPEYFILNYIIVFTRVPKYIYLFARENFIKRL